jgi:hypothetical protein
MRSTLKGAAVLLASTALAGAAAAAPARPLPRGSYGARIAQCAQAAQPADRLVGLHAAIRGVPGAERLGVRVDLLERQPGDSDYSALSGSGLGSWRLSDPIASHPRRHQLVVEQEVTDLAAPAAYRFRVGFRWYGPGGRVIASRQVVTAACRQVLLHG